LDEGSGWREQLQAEDHGLHTRPSRGSARTVEVLARLGESNL